MTQKELLEQTLNKIVEKDEGLTTIVSIIKEGINTNAELGEMCQKAHEMIKEMKKTTFEKTFPIAYQFDMWKRDNNINLGYGSCFKPRTKCEKCKYEVAYIYGQGDANKAEIDANKAEIDPNKAEIDHYITRLLYEIDKNYKPVFRGVQEAGLFIIALEVLGKKDLAEKLASEKMEKMMDKEEFNKKQKVTVQDIAKNEIRIS